MSVVRARQESSDCTKATQVDVTLRERPCAMPTLQEHAALATLHEASRKLDHRGG